MRWKIIFGFGAVILLIDQITKMLVVGSMHMHESIALTGFLNLVHVRNRGAAFGFLNDPSISWQFYFFCGATVAAVILVLLIARSADEKDKMMFTGLGLLLGGALGNLIDRLRYREVIDFIDAHYAGWHWPAFNVADIAICLGAAFTAIALLRFKPDKK